MVVPIGVGGQVTFFNGLPGTTDIVIDVTGYLSPANANVVAGRTFHTRGRRLYDSRTIASFSLNETRTINVRGSDAIAERVPQVGGSSRFGTISSW